MNTLKNTIQKGLFCILILSGLILNSCSKDLSENRITQIKYGTSFGMCMGYCKHNILLKSDTITYVCSGWSDTLQSIIRTELENPTTWDSVSGNLTIKDFFELPHTIGCPDCTDDGAEWLEIDLADGGTHKVIYEYGKEPALLKNSVAILRKLMSKNNCNR